MEWLIIYSLSSFYLVRLIRSFKYVHDKYLLKARKPFACNVCMSFWSNLVVSVPFVYLSNADIIYLPASIGLTLILVDRFSLKEIDLSDLEDK